MDDFDERQAAQALATIQTHQDRARRAARVPWWAYAAMFVLVAGISAANDFVTLSAAKVMAGVVLVLLAGAVGLHDYPGTVFGVLFGAVFTALFALGQLLLRSAQPRTGR